MPAESPPRSKMLRSLASLGASRFGGAVVRVLSIAVLLLESILRYPLFEYEYRCTEYEYDCFDEQLLRRIEGMQEENTVRSVKPPATKTAA